MNSKYYTVIILLFLTSCNNSDTISLDPNIEQDSTSASLKPSTNKDYRILIPVIFHVLYNNKSENISTDSLLKELENVHRDFLKLNADTNIIHPSFKARIGTASIDFFLADTLIKDQSEKGIIRKNVSNNRYTLYKKSTIINPEKYLNVYIGNIKSDGFVNTNPWTFPADDAIHLNYKYVGSRYRLMTHEIGHWLGLWHTYEDGCKNGGDEIDDTPPQKSATDGDCEICPPLAQDQSCDSSISNYNNFMDYSGCRVMFTKDQVAKMRSTIMNHRKKLFP